MRKLSESKIVVYFKYFIPIIIIFAVCLYHIKDNSIIRICGDEFGYWAAGSWMAGYDWSDVQGANSYYGYGYGVVLAIILKIARNSIIAYRCALILNIVFICIMYLIALRLLDIFDIDKVIPDNCRIIIAFVGNLYVSNVFYTQFTMSEVFLAFLFWILFFLFALTVKNGVSMTKNILILFISVFTFSVHMRMIGVIFVSILFLVYLNVQEKKINKHKNLLILFLLCIGLFISIFVIQKMYKESFSIEGITQTANDITTQTKKFGRIFSKDGIRNFIYSLSGKIFYAMASTFIIYAYFVIKVIDWTICDIKHCKMNTLNLKFSDKTIMGLFLSLANLSQVMIGAIFMTNITVRQDALVYGRYFEFTMMPIIFICMYVIYMEHGCNKKQIISSIMVFLVFSIAVNYVNHYDAPQDNYWINATGLYKVMQDNEFRINTYLFIAMVDIFIFLLIMNFGSMYKIRRYLLPIAYVFTGIIWISLAKYDYEEGCLSWSNTFTESEIKLLATIEELEAEDDLIYYCEKNNYRVQPIQFLLKEHNIKIAVSLEDIETSGKKYVLTTSKDYESTGDITDDYYEFIAQSSWLKLWERKEYKNDIH